MLKLPCLHPLPVFKHESVKNPLQSGALSMFPHHVSHLVYGKKSAKNNYLTALLIYLIKRTVVHIAKELFREALRH
jgi:hypothetical protein